MNMRVTAAALAVLATSVSALADIKIDDHFTVSGYAVASYKYVDASPGGSSHDTNVDTALLGTSFDFKPVSGKVSAAFFNGGFGPTGANELTLLDAYVTVQMADGFSATAGNFLSYMGYESFYPVNMDQITFANGDFLAPIPGYHTGARIDYAGATSSAGFAILDSVYSPKGPIRGDGEIKHNAGFEYFYSYTGINFWASYKVSDKVRVAAEYANKDGGPGAKGYNWLTFLNYSITEKTSCAFRISGEKVTGGPGFTKYTICPAYAITPNVTVRAEYSHQNYTNFTTDSSNYFGVQAVFKL